MTGVRKLHSGELIELRPGHARVTPDAGVTVHASETSGLGNVVPFQRPRVAESHAPDVTLPTDAARLPTWRRTEWLALFLLLSFGVHAALLWLIAREPEPLASIGIEVISAEIVLGATTPAGVAPVSQGEQQEDSKRNDATDPQQTEPQREAEQKATEQPQNVQVARQETAPEQDTTLERQADERMPDDNAAAPREERQPAEPKPAIAMVESATPDMATAAPREIPPDTMDVSLLPQPEEKPVEEKPEPKSVQAAPPKPVRNAAKAPERRRIDAPTRDRATREAKAAPAIDSAAAKGVGVGRSSNDTNYQGLVSAHLARYKQYPADARSRGDGGSATVAFSLSGSGGVTSVRLTRGSGVASIDQEVQAMVRRASPFPAPPDGRPVSFAIPVSFRLQ